jgi:hypothetical protein
MISSVDAEKAFDKIQHHFMIKGLMNPSKNRIYLNIIKVINIRPIANIILSGEKLKILPIRSRM